MYKELERFLREEGGFAPPLGWSKLVLQSKNNLKKVLGESALDFESPLSSVVKEGESHQPVISGFLKETADSIENRFSINKTIVAKYGLTLHEALSRQTISDPQGRQAKASRVLQRELHAQGKVVTARDSEFLQSCLSRIGQIKSEHSPSKVEVDIVVSSHPSSFAHLGHYGSYVDSCSCFRQGGERQRDKYRLGLLEDSFVVLLRDPKTREVHGRCWGLYDKAIDAFHLSNFYGRHAPREEIIKAFRVFIKRITGEEYLFAQEDLLYFDEDLLYVNERSETISRTEMERCECYYELDREMISCPFGICADCGDEIEEEDDAFSIDRDILCEACYDISFEEAR